MRLVTTSIIFVAISVVASAIVINAPSKTVNLNNSTDVIAENRDAKSYILQGATPESLHKLVDRVGGNVSRKFPIINAISAMLTPNQAAKIRELGSVRIQDDRSVVTSGLLTEITSSITKKVKMNNHIAEQVEADRVHDLGIKGQGVTVAVVDSGTNLWGSIGSYLFRDSSSQQRVSVKYDAFRGRQTYYYNDDQNGHGSHVSGIIASSLKDEDNKFNGIAPDVYLLSVKAFDQNGESSYSKVLDGLNWIFENRYKYKIRVVNMSLGAQVNSHYWQDPINQAVMRLWDAGVVVVSSAGNNGEDMGITVPGNTPYIITVGATTDSSTPHDISDDRVATFSAKGPTYEGFIKPEVVAYGTKIATKMDNRFFRTLFQLSSLGQDYSEISGTSQAAAMVSGIAALIISNDPYVTPNDVKCRIMQAATPATSNGMLSYSPFAQGAGLVNAYNAVMSQASSCANTNLNIKEDLLGINHFAGPAKVDANGDFYIQLADGTVLTKGMHWSEETVGVQGMHWSEETVGVQGMHWSEETVGVQGMHWNQEVIGVQGMHWSAETVGVQGMHWSEETVGVQGMHWSAETVNVQASDLDVAPIDPNVQVPIVVDGWQ